MKCHRSMMILVIHILLLTTTAHAIGSYQTYRLDCEALCQNIQEFSGYCPTHGSCQWFCQEKQANCQPGIRYHCARDLTVEETFVVACAQETFCRAGEEPRISLHRASSNVNQSEASVFCHPCFKRERFNSRYNTSSATFSECPSVKTNLCTEQAHKVDCEYASYRELTKTDGYCRCDARKGYAAQSVEMCFYDNKRCFKKICPQGEELLLNYSCAKECGSGQARPKTSDNCQHVITLPTATPSVFTTVVEDNSQHLSTEKPDNSPGLNKHIHAWIVTWVAVLVIAGIIFLVVCEHKIGMKSPMSTPASNINDGQGATSPVSSQQNSQLQSSESSPLESERVGFIGQNVRKSVFECMSAMNLTEAKQRIACVKIINESQLINFDKLKELDILPPDPKVFTRLDISTIPQYTALGPRDKTWSIYEIISLILYGNPFWHQLLRIAAARFALNNFKNYVKQLVNEFVNSGKRYDSVTSFCKMHDIIFKYKRFRLFEFDVAETFVDIVRGLVTEGKGHGPFYLQILCDSLDISMVTIVKDSRDDVRHVIKVQRLNLPLKSNASKNRELHVYWTKSRGECPYKYNLVPLFKNVSEIEFPVNTRTPN